MPVIFGKAPGKIILFGEHAVVYGQPAIAIPVTKVTATARVFPNLDTQSSDVRVQAPDIQLDAALSELPEDHSIAAAIRLILAAIAPENIPTLTVNFSSTIPVSAGMGSSAAVSIALIRALSAFFGKMLSPAEVSDLAYQAEKLHHGTPSGIDNNVIAHQQPVYFMRDNPIQFLEIQNPTHWVIADTGEKTPTSETVAAVRDLHAKNPEEFEKIFSQIGTLTQKAREALISGDVATLGALMIENQRLLEQLAVSSQKLDDLINTALGAGAAGAKLSGGGRGGNIIALATPDTLAPIERALSDAGATRTITTLLSGRRQA